MFVHVLDVDTFEMYIVFIDYLWYIVKFIFNSNLLLKC